MKHRDRIRELIVTTVRQIAPGDKLGEEVIKPAIAKSLEAADYEVDVGDRRRLLASGIAVWRSRKTGEIVPTKTRRQIDLVVYADDQPVALVEVESDLKAVREHGFTSGSGEYDVYSISRNSAGEWFNSYKSLERMGVAAFYFARRDQNADEIELTLSKVESDEPSKHNPMAMPIFLVSGKCKPEEQSILLPRLRSLDANLIFSAGDTVSD